MTKELKNFYPTPQSLIKKMVDKIVKVNEVKILEPSAGRGDIVDYIEKNQKEIFGYYKWNGRIDIDCIEIDDNLQKILTGKGLRVVYNNFLDFSTYKIYDLIIMNPPFDCGDKHLLKAISLMEKTGGQIICLLNAETLKNPYSVYRQDLINKMEVLKAEVEFLEDEFKNADRKTSVEVALININIPKQQLKGEILTKMVKDNDNYENNIEFKKPIKYEYIKNLISSYNFEMEIGIKLIREYRTIREFTKSDDGYTKISLGLDGINHDELTENTYIKIVRRKYWKRLYYKEELLKLFTNSIRQKFFDNIEKMADYDFNEFNINQMLKNLSENMENSLKDDIINLFDELSIKHHWIPEAENNIHYYNGWYTNKSYYINKKVIIPLNSFDMRWNRGFKFRYSTMSKIQDLHKTFTYLDNENEIKEDVDIFKIFSEAEKVQQSKNIEFPYFTVTLYKKGTCHIKFKNDDLLLKFNIYGSQMKNWLPPSYGKKAYNDMNQEEKNVINSFQGEEGYNKVIENYSKYIYNTRNINLLTF